MNALKVFYAYLINTISTNSMILNRIAAIQSDEGAQIFLITSQLNIRKNGEIEW